MSSTSHPAAPNRKGAGVAKLSFVLLLLCLLALAAIVIAYRLGELGLREAFGYIEWVVYAGCAVAVLALAGAVLAIRRNRPGAIALSLLTLAAALLVAWVPYGNRLALSASPRLSDITTDTVDPPAFDRIVVLRKATNARNALAYSREKAALQRKNYPDIKTVTLKVPPDAAFERALAAVRRMGWDVVRADKAAGAIEAFETSLVFGFVDDVAVRVRADGAGSRVDIRSSSRVGRRDAGMNAKRVRKLMRANAGS